MSNFAEDREFIAVLKYDGQIASRYDETNGNDETSPGDFLEREFGWVSPSGIELGDWALVDSDVPWERYARYLVQWAIDHSDPGYEGSCPACYDEWRSSGEA